MNNKTVWIPVEEVTPELSNIGIDSHKVSKIVKVKRLLRDYEKEHSRYDEGYFTDINTWNNIAGNRIYVTRWMPNKMTIL